MKYYAKHQLVYIAQGSRFTHGNVIEDDQEFVRVKLMSGAEDLIEKDCVFEDMDKAIAKFKKDNNLK